MQPKTIHPARLFDFIRGSELALVFVSAHRLHRFNRVLARRLLSEHKDIALGVMRLPSLLRAGPSALRFLHQGLRACDAPSAFGVLPGYYLFRGGEMLAWDSGVPGFVDIGSLARSALAGAVWSGVSNDVSFMQRVLLLATDQSAAERMGPLFAQAIESARAQREAPRATEAPPADELYWAYQVLGVVPTATDREVHDAWRRRRTQHHPDHAGNDPAEFERRTRVSRDINLARDIIMKHRHPRARGAPHAWAS